MLHPAELPCIPNENWQPVENKQTNVRIEKLRTKYLQSQSDCEKSPNKLLMCTLKLMNEENLYAIKQTACMPTKSVFEYFNK